MGVTTYQTAPLILKPGTPLTISSFLFHTAFFSDNVLVSQSIVSYQARSRQSRSFLSTRRVRGRSGTGGSVARRLAALVISQKDKM